MVVPRCELLYSKCYAKNAKLPQSSENEQPSNNYDSTEDK